MFKQYATIFRRFMMLFDWCLVCACFFAAYSIRSRYLPELQDLRFYLELCPLIASLWIISMFWLQMYESFRFKPTMKILETVAKAMLMTFGLFGAVMYAFKITEVSRSFILLVFALSTGALMLEKFILVMALREIRRRGLNFRNILVVGTNQRAQHFIRKLDHHRDLGIHVIGVLDQDPRMTGKDIHGHKVIGGFGDLPDILARQVIDEVFFIVPRSALGRIEPLIRHCELTGTTVNVAVDLFNLRFAVAKEGSLIDLPLITFQTVSDKAGQLLLKRVIDVVLAAAILVLISPLYLLTAILIKLTSPGPVYFVQERYGLQGRKFKLYKFRTMVIDAEQRLKDLLEKNEMQGPAFKLKNDPRVTPIGKFLRKFSIDELPQLWNVMHGDMSLVGPRPPIPREVEQYDYWQRRRLSMRPGITCLWQVNGRNDIPNFNQWVELDLEYIDNWSLELDFKILARTISVVLSAAGAR